jgi:hypothetical protein
MKDLIGFLVVAVVASLIAAVVGFLYFQIPADLLVTWGMGGLSLIWLLILLTLPWNLHFEAKHLLFEMQRSRERGIPVNPEREAYAVSLRDRMLKASVAAHVASAALMAGGTWLLGGSVGYYFSGFYLLGTFIRPGFEYYSYQRRRLRQMTEEVHYPREDVVKLRADVLQLKTRADRHDEQLEELTRSLGQLGERLESRVAALGNSSQEADRHLERQVTALGHKFEETIGRLTDNQEILAGIKAFLRMVREDR